jgi:hypothetical protein
MWQAKQLTQDINAAKAPQQLLTLLQQHDLNHIHISAAYICAEKQCRGVQSQSAAMQQLLRHLHQLAETQQQQCGARQLANIMWSCGRLRYPATVQLLLPELLQSSKLQLAEPQAVSNTLWAAATLGMQYGDRQQLVQHLVRMLPQASPQAVSNSLWAAATMGVQLSRSVVQQLVQHFLLELPQAKHQHVSNTLLAVATTGLQMPSHQLDQLLTHLQAQQSRCQPQAVANSVWACGRMQYAPLQLLSALEHEPVLLTGMVAAAVPQGLANMAWACGELGYKGKLLPGVLLQQAVQLLQGSKAGSFTAQGMCNLCWCAAVLDQQQYVPQMLQLAAACKHTWGTAVGENICQLYHVHLWLLDSQLPAPGQGLLGVLSQQQQCSSARTAGSSSWQRAQQSPKPQTRTDWCLQL